MTLKVKYTQHFCGLKNDLLKVSEPSDFVPYAFFIRTTKQKANETLSSKMCISISMTNILKPNKS